MDVDDEAIWTREQSLWSGDFETYRDLIDAACLMVVPAPPFILRGAEAVDTVARTPRWTTVELTDRQLSRPQDGIVVIAYKASADRDDAQPYEAHCTTTWRRLGEGQWLVAQHQQTPPLVASVEAAAAG
jgi:ketosteroid isomerase-like protein